MDPNTSIRRLCLREDNRISLNDGVESNGEWDTPEYHDTADSGKNKEATAFTFYRMETKDISERYDAACFVNDLEAYDGEINLERDKNLISNEFAIKLCLEHEVKNGDKVVKKELIIILKANRIADFKNGIITIYLDLDPFLDDSDKANDSKDDWGVILECIDFGAIPEIDGIELPPYVCNMGKSSRNKKKPSKNFKMKPIFNTLKYGDGYNKVLDTILLDKLKQDGELELEEVEANEETIMEYKAIKEKDDPRRFDTHALADTGSNINIIPYRIFEELRREPVKPVSHNVSMLNHSEAEPMGMLKDILCQLGVATVPARFLILDMPVDRTVLIIVGRNFLHTCGWIIKLLRVLLQLLMVFATKSYMWPKYRIMVKKATVMTRSNKMMRSSVE
uniref:Reverse transcriptase domain-containing protein n=1 Tax=Tanacetum cinerariifolium TaxID=118510 RepID=A0A6L2NNZ5_TANCI|nr:hypothetical protein [Tanacetum cinerariifolium]